MYICGGTVFNQVVIWKPSHIDQSRVAPLDYIAGHNGVIFAIEYQPHTQVCINEWFYRFSFLNLFVKVFRSYKN